MKTAFDQIKLRFSTMKSPFMSGDCVLLRNEKDLESLRNLAIRFAN